MEISGHYRSVEGYHALNIEFALDALDSSSFNYRANAFPVRCIRADPPLPGNIELDAAQTKYVASIYDKDYLPYGNLTANPAATGTEDADGTPEATTINIDGVIDTANGITVSIPYTVTGSAVDLPAYTSGNIAVPSRLIQLSSDVASTDGGGASVRLVLSYPAVTLPVGTGTITATIKAVTSDMHAVKLDIQRGTGSDLGLLLASFPLVENDQGDIGKLNLKVISGIPDRMYGVADNNGDTDTHSFLYLPVISSSTGRAWLNNNLGGALC